jgi:23S rRNA pseudouridine2605 synthase/23S rRNA pseudouridine2604 synthase
VNGQAVLSLGTSVDPEKDSVEFDGHAVCSQKEFVYVALNKPRGYVTSCDQPQEKIVLDLIDLPQRIFPVGRLDKDSSGLILLTNDGSLHHRLSHPSFSHEKEYEVTVEKEISQSALLRMAKGLPILGGVTRPARVERLGPRRFRIVLKEGKNRQIRRMVEKTGNKVTELHRVRVANVPLGDLPPGAWRFLTGEEKAELLTGKNHDA